MPEGHNKADRLGKTDVEYWGAEKGTALLKTHKKVVRTGKSVTTKRLVEGSANTYAVVVLFGVTVMGTRNIHLELEM